MLDEFAGLLLEPFALSRVEVEATLDGTDLRAVARTDGETSGGPRTTVPLLAGDVSIGTWSRSDPTAAGRSIATTSCSWRRRRARPPLRSTGRGWTRARGSQQLDAETNQLRAAMFSSVTHDLRTPLASSRKPA